MKVSRERYQHGSVRKVPRSQGFAWEFRFYITAPDGKRKLKVQTFDSGRHPTEHHVRKAVEVSFPPSTQVRSAARWAPLSVP